MHPTSDQSALVVLKFRYVIRIRQEASQQRALVMMERAQDDIEDALAASGSQEYTSSHAQVSALSRVVYPVVEIRMKIKASFRTMHE